MSKGKTEHNFTESTSEPTSEGELPFIAQVCGSYNEQPITNCSEVLIISDEEDWVILYIFITVFSRKIKLHNNVHIIS